MQRPESAAISPFASLISAFPDGSSCHTEVSMSHKVAWLQSWEISSPHPPFKVFFKGLYWTHDRYMSHNLDMEKKTIKTITVLVQVSVLRKGGVAIWCASIPVRWSGFEIHSNLSSLWARSKSCQRALGTRLLTYTGLKWTTRPPATSLVRTVGIQIRNRTNDHLSPLVWSKIFTPDGWWSSGIWWITPKLKL